LTPRTPIEIPIGEGVVLRGEACEGGELWAVLAHDQGEDLDRWHDIPEQLAAYGVSAVALDLRGHGGSDGEPDAASTPDDLELAIDAARQRGAAAVVVIAAGGTATAALDCSSAEAAVAITPPAGSADPSPERPPARLLIVSADPAASAACEAFQAQPGRRTLVARVPVADTGLDLLAGAWGTNVASYIVTFVRRVGLELQASHAARDRETPGGGR
jgi:pimeloyl-ACP methyl ester carboxylesterase